MKAERRTRAPKRRRKHPLDRAQRIAWVIGGMLVGAFASVPFVIMGYVHMTRVDGGNWWFPGGIFLAIVTASGILGGVFGDRYFDWISRVFSGFADADGGGDDVDFD